MSYTTRVATLELVLLAIVVGIAAFGLLRIDRHLAHQLHKTAQQSARDGAR